ncbi:MAG: hypothetical protein SNJ70_05340 [Armatimonadota bacterium]
MKKLSVLYIFIMLFIFCNLAFSANQFVVVGNKKLLYNGQEYKLKGTNYYPKNAMWAAMWTSWNSQRIIDDANMLSAMGVNSVRILVPYAHGGWSGANPPETRLKQLEDTINIFGFRGIRSCVTLFDWETTFPAAGTQRESEHYSYINAIVNRLKDNKFVMMWDIKNEPDHPDNNWLDVGAPNYMHDMWLYRPNSRNAIVSWLGRMYNHIKSIDTNHPVTIGIRYYANYYDVRNYTDICSFHSYWPTQVSSHILSISYSSGTRPIICQEFGWPTNPTPCNRDGVLVYDYTEADQLNNYQMHFNAFIQRNIAGCMQWMTFDTANYTQNPNEDYGKYFGLFRYDNSLKPAGVYFRDNYPVNLFPWENTIPPKPVTSLTATAGDLSNVVYWSTPDEMDLSHVEIRWSTQGYPQTINDGNLLISMPAHPNKSYDILHSNLNSNVTYYYSAFAVDLAGNPSTPVFVSSIPYNITLNQIKQQPTGTQISISNLVVTAVFAANNCIYASEADRSTAIRLSLPSSGYSEINVSDVISVTGSITEYKPDGVNSAERIINVNRYNIIGTSEPIKPLAMNNLAIGGGSFSDTVKGVKDGYGIHNFGTLAKVTGIVNRTFSSGIFYIDDGSEIPDISGRIGVLISPPSNAHGLVVGDYVSVIGIIESSIPVGWTESRRFIRVRSIEDIVKYN